MHLKLGILFCSPYFPKEPLRVSSLIEFQRSRNEFSPVETRGLIMTICGSALAFALAAGKPAASPTFSWNGAIRGTGRRWWFR
jgi:hypothetical protein